MDGRVGGIFKLLRHPGVFGFRGQFFGHGDGALHPFGGRGEHEFGAQHGKESAAFKRHALGHGEDEPVPLGGSYEGQCNTGVAAGGFNDHGILRQSAVGFCRLDHGHADAIFYAGERIKKFAFQQYGGIDALGDFVESHERSAAHGFHDVIIDFAHDLKFRCGRNEHGNGGAGKYFSVNSA